MKFQSIVAEGPLSVMQRVAYTLRTHQGIEEDKLRTIRTVDASIRLASPQFDLLGQQLSSVLTSQTQHDKSSLWSHPLHHRISTNLNIQSKLGR